MTENLIQKSNKKTNKIILVSSIYIISALLYLFIRIGGKFGLFNFLGNQKSLVLNSVVQLVCIAGIPILFYTLFGSKNVKQTFKDFKFTSVPAKIVGDSFLLGIVLYGIILYLSSAWGSLVGLTGYKTPLFSLNFNSSVWEEFGLNVLLTCLFPAFCEEILLRGCVLSGLEKMGRKRAIILVGLLFGFLHVNINQVFYASILGMILCLITMMTGSIWPAIIMHFTSNFCSVFSTFIFKLNLFDGKLNEFVYMFFSGNIVTSVLNYVIFAFLIVSAFFIIFARFIKYSKSKSLFDKLSCIMSEGKIKTGDKIEINDQTGEALIQMKNIVQAEMFSQIESARRPFDFVLPPNENDKYKPTLLEWIFVASALVLTGGATLVSFLGGIF